MYQYPYGNAQQLNLDWLMEQWQTVKQSIDGSLQGEIDRVEAAITDLLAARDAAVAAAGAANTSAGAAAASAQAAAADAATATAQAAAATQERVNAAQAANNAQSYAGNAQTQAAAAQNSAGQAAASASQAAADASDAHDDALSASGSAVNAAASAAGALQNFQLSDAARQAAQAAEQDAEAAATLLQPPATSADIGKALIVKTVGGGTVTAYELGESGGGGGGDTPAIVNTIENVPVASFEDGTAKPAKTIVVGIEPVQSGSGIPAPDNVRPITGWTGADVNVAAKNLLNLENTSGFVDAYGSVTSTLNSNNGFDLVNTHSGNRTVYLDLGVYEAGTYYVSVQSNGVSTLTVVGEDKNTFIGSINTLFTLSAKQRLYIQGFAQSGSSSTSDIGVFFEDPVTYSPYTGTTIPYTFPTEAGTVYGGTLAIYENGTGELTIKNGSIIFDGSESWTAYAAANGFSRSITGMAVRNRGTGFCDTFKILAGSDGAISNAYGIALGLNSSTAYFAGITTNIQDVTDVTTWKAWLAQHHVHIVYELATPVTYQLTAQQVITLLYSVNNVWADTGNIIMLQYYADSKGYIDEQTTLVKALIAPVLNDMIADTALTANDFRIVDNTLYRITAPVAAGAALTPNTNCTATTIGAVLKTLLT